MGRYVWQRFDIISERITVTNPAIYMNLLTSSEHIDVLDADFNIAEMNVPFDVFFDGFRMASHTSGYRGYFFRKDPNTNNYLSLMMNSTQAFGSFRRWEANMQYPKTGQLWGDSQTVMGIAAQAGFSYTGEKVLRDWVLQAKCFVTSNRIDEYPSDGIQRGYYYKLFGHIGSARTLNIAPQLFNEVKDLSIEEIKTEVNENGKM